MTAHAPINLYDLTRDELQALFVHWGFSPVHATRLWNYLYLELAGVFSAEAMPELPEKVRARLRTGATLGVLPVALETDSSDGFTRKYLLTLADRQRIETVLMRFTGRVTACISSQVGCAMGCVFCATGQMGYLRHLTPGEIVAQAVHVARALRLSTFNSQLSTHQVPRLRNVVLMGMGEPLHNYDAVMHAIDILRDSSGLAIGAERITLSTVGVVPGILRLARERRPMHLAVSLHSADQAERAALVPAARKWPLEELMAACRTYSDTLDRRVFYEWTLIEGKERFAGTGARRRPAAPGPAGAGEPDSLESNLRLRWSPDPPGGCPALPADPRARVRAAEHRPPAARHRHRRGLRPARRGGAIQLKVSG